MTIQVQTNLALGEFNLSTDIVVPDSGITGVFGESGSGKTTLARTIAGLEQSSVGLVRFRETIWQENKKKLFIELNFNLKMINHHLRLLFLQFIVAIFWGSLN